MVQDASCTHGNSGRQRATQYAARCCCVLCPFYIVDKSDRNNTEYLNMQHIITVLHEADKNYSRLTVKCVTPPPRMKLNPVKPLSEVRNSLCVKEGIIHKCNNSMYRPLRQTTCTGCVADSLWFIQGLDLTKTRSSDQDVLVQGSRGIGDSWKADAEDQQYHAGWEEMQATESR